VTALFYSVVAFTVSLQMPTAFDRKTSLPNSKILGHFSQNRISCHSLIFQKVGSL